MKKLFFGILAMAAMAACATDETVVASKGDAIEFGNAFVDSSVRVAVGEAADPSYGPLEKQADLTQFNVYGAVNGVNIFNGNLVKKESADYGEAWTLSGTPQYWISKGSYIFDAVVDATRVTTDTATATGLPTSLYYEVAGQKDMLHARFTTTGKPDGDGIVAFTFPHLLSKVKFTVENTTAAGASNYRYRVSDITLTNVYTQGECAVPNHTWSEQKVGTYSIAEMIVNSASTEECTAEVLLIPGTEVGISFILHIEMSNDNWATVTEVPMSDADSKKAYTAVVTLEANKAYNLKATVSLGDPIQFTATEMGSWDNGNTADTDNPADGTNDIVPVPAN